MKNFLLFILFPVLSFGQILPIPQAEKNALLSLYNSTGGEQWAIKWDLSQDPSSWYGIKIENSKVVEIKLNANNLKGAAPSLSGLNNLKKLYLNSNNLSGSIPLFWGSMPLEELDISENNFSGDPAAALSSINRLKKLDIGYNQFGITDGGAFIANLPYLESLGLAATGLKAVPEPIGKLSRLEKLDLSENTLKEDYSVLANSSHLTELKLSNVGLTSIPKEISAWKNLTTLDVSKDSIKNYNHLSGSATKIEWLSLENNKLKTIPAEIGSLKQLVHLNLNDNSLNNFSTLNQLPELQQLFINQNNLTAIPVEILGLKKLQMLSLVGNNLTGNLPEQLPSITFIQNNRYTLSEIKDFLARNNSFTELSYSPQRYDEPLVINATPGSNIKLTQSLSSADGYAFSWLKNLHENMNSLAENHYIQHFKPEDATMYTAEAYYIENLPNTLLEISFFREPITVNLGALSTSETNASFFIYPNPATDFLNIHSDNIKVEKSYIYDLSGKLLFTETKKSINVSHLPTGVYLLVAITDNGNRSFKFIKK